MSVGGAGFKPTINAEALEGLSRKSAAWQASDPDEQLRRSVYMFLKRGLLPPMMTTFDLCDPTQSCGKRDVTIVPTQALALLNNQFVHDRSEHLASAIAKQQSDVAEQDKLAWSRVMNRQPSPLELERSLKHVATQLKTFSTDQGDENSAAPRAEDKMFRTSQTLALASLCHVLMNSNEFMYVD